ncbi:hypothetical protein MACJ_004082 [Theileria orientalis]|uniref:Uncharacterized protein n=1 Tax=Theileria orientalis TaxID=68886 RepID=A0A976XK16_THEOR|nr:hypothetical protein MACJ_004082 [Theileria orientalis]
MEVINSVRSIVSTSGSTIVIGQWYYVLVLQLPKLGCCA